MKRRKNRAELVAETKKAVRLLVKHDRLTALSHVMEGTGFRCNTSPKTSKDLGAAIIALVDVIDLSWVRCAYEQTQIEIRLIEAVDAYSFPSPVVA